MQRKSTAAICLLAIAMLLACSQNSPPNSLFDSAGYHVKDDKVYYLNAFPGKAFEMTDAEAGSFELLDRTNFAKDRHHVYQHDRVISDDPAHFVLLDGDLAKDSHVVYWSDGSVLSEDPAHFAIISNADNYLFTKDGSTVHVNGKPIANADSSTFQVLQGAYTRDGQRVFYFDQQIADADLSSFRKLDGPYASDATHVYWTGKTIASADPRSFPPGRAVTNCSETSISFAQ
jgi:DKNYY family